MTTLDITAAPARSPFLRFFHESLEIFYDFLRLCVPLVPLICVAYGVLFVLDPDTAYRWGFEDGPVEWVGAFALGTACVLFARLACASRVRSISRVWLALLAVLFLFGTGEEISWGQRIFRFSTPEVIAEQNRQGEANIHNLAIFHALNEDGTRKSGLALWLTGERVFSLFWLGFGVLLPFFHLASLRFRRLIDLTGMPVPSLSLGAFFPIIYLTAEFLVPYITGARSELGYALMETKESLYSVIFALVAFDLLRRQRRGDTAEARSH